MKNLIVGAGLVTILSSCGSAVEPAGPGGPGEADAAPPVAEKRGLDRCALGGGRLQVQWEVDNAHGSVLTMATDPMDTVVLSSADKTVKQWVFGLDGPQSPEPPVYGDPFSPGADVTTALTLSPDLVIGGNQAGEATVWLRADSSLSKRQTVAESPISAISMREDGRSVAALAGGVVVWNIDTGAVSDPLPTRLWAVTDVAYVTHGLILGGHIYQDLAVERWDAANPDEPIDAWEDGVAGGAKIAATLDGARLVAAGNDRIVVLPLGNLAAGPLARATPNGHSTLAVALTPSGDSFATLTRENALNLWTTADANLRSTVAVPPSVGIGIDQAGEHLFLAEADGHLRAYVCGD